MSRALKDFIWQFGLLSIGLFVIHTYIVSQLFSEILLYFPLWSIYLFNSVLVIIVFLVLYFKIRSGSKKAYQIFLLLTLVKMALAIVFLLPLFFGKTDSPEVDVINFFIPYFLFLGFEIWTLNNFLKKL